MSVLPVGIAASGDEGYTIEDSLRFRSSASAYLSRTFSTPTDNKKWTWSSWVKRGILSTASYSIFGQYTNSTNRSDLYFDANNKLNFYNYVSGSVSPSPQLITSQAFRDPSAWYHIVLVWDSNNATAADRQIIYVNGTRITSYQSSATVALGQSSQINSATGHTIGEFENVNVNFDGYLTEINFIDGQALDPTDFGEFDEDTGVWKPKEYEGTYGTNGFYLDGSGVTDSSGNGNNWTNNNLNLTTSSATTYDLMNDVPTLTDENNANFCTWNPLYRNGGKASSILAYSTYSNGNLTVSVPTNSYATSTIKMTGGKVYAETNLDTVTAESMWGFIWAEEFSATSITNASTKKWAGKYHSYAPADIQWYDEGTQQATTTITLANNDTLQWALDVDNGKAWLGVNNTWYDSSGGTTGNPSTGSNPTFTLTADEASNLRLFVGNGSSTSVYSTNFGQRPFAYTPPTGFKKLNTYNLPDSDILIGAEHMKTVEWTGTTAAQSIDFGMQPDLIWAKGVNSGAGHRISDSVRGGNGTHLYNISTSSTAVENTDTVIDAITSTGIDLGTLNHPNNNGTVYVGWGWKANGSGVSNTVGDTNATVSANTTSGFSIVSFNAGAAGNHTVGHGLGVTPEMIIMKDRNSSGYGNWTVFHSAVCTSTSNYLLLNGTGALGSVANSWGSALPTSTVFGFGSNVNVAANDNIIAYCFAPVEGFSAFGSYTGNGSTDGPFVYTGFKPSWLMVKSTTYSGTNWLIFDNARNLYNVVELELNANNNNQEYNNGRDVDFLNNGFKVRSGANNNFNTSGGNYIYVAFAENPFKNSLAR